MLSELVELPFGLSLTLGTFLIVFKYVYCAVFCLWAVAAPRFRKAGFLAGGIGLCLFGLLSMKLPLGRPYGLVDSSELLPSLADSMVTAARGTPFDGWRLQSPNQHPAWSLLLGLSSGFDPARLLTLVPWLGVFTLVLFSGITLLGLRLLEDASAPQESRDDSPVAARHLAVLSALLLSSGQLDFLTQPHIFWPHVLLVEPQRALSLPLVLLASGLSLSPSRSRAALGAAALGVLAHLDLTYFFLTAGAVALTILWSGSRSRVAASLSLAGGVVLSLPRLASLADDPWVSTIAGDGFVSSLASTVWIPSPLPFLAVLAVAGTLRWRRPADRFGSFLVLGCLLAWAAGRIGTVAFETSGFPLLIRYLESLLAGYGFHRLLRWMQSLPGAAGEVGKRRLGLTLGLVALLPWTFFFWWQPRTMDPLFRESRIPLSPRMEGLAGWVRENTAKDSVLLVGKSLGPWVPAFTGRQVLVLGDSTNARAREDLRTALDALEGDDPSSFEAMRRLGVTHVVVLRGDQDRAPRLAELAADSRLLRHVHSVARWARVYAVADAESHSSSDR